MLVTIFLSEEIIDELYLKFYSMISIDKSEFINDIYSTTFLFSFTLYNGTFLWLDFFAFGFKN